MSPPQPLQRMPKSRYNSVSGLRCRHATKGKEVTEENLGFPLFRRAARPERRRALPPCYFRSRFADLTMSPMRFDSASPERVELGAVPPTMSMPSTFSVSPNSGSFTAFTISALIFSSTAAGVPFGAMMLYQPKFSNPGTLSEIGGTSGSSGARFVLVTPIGPHAPALNDRERSGDDRERGVDLAPGDVQERLRDAFVRHVQHLRARHVQEVHHAQVLAAARARRAVAKLRLLRELDELRHRFHRQLRIDDEHVGHGADERDRREVPVEVELEVLVDLRRDEKLRGHHQPRVAVGRRARDDLRAERAGDARPRIHDDALVPRLVEPFREHAGDDVRPGARRAADDEADRRSGIGARFAACDGRRESAVESRSGKHRQAAHGPSSVLFDWPHETCCRFPRAVAMARHLRVGVGRLLVFKHVIHPAAIRLAHSCRKQTTGTNIALGAPRRLARIPGFRR